MIKKVKMIRLILILAQKPENSIFRYNLLEKCWFRIKVVFNIYKIYFPCKSYDVVMKNLLGSYLIVSYLNSPSKFYDYGGKPEDKGIPKEFHGKFIPVKWMRLDYRGAM